MNHYLLIMFIAPSLLIYLALNDPTRSLVEYGPNGCTVVSRITAIDSIFIELRTKL